MTRKQKKMLIRILAAAVLMLILHFLPRFAEIGKKGVLALMADSTNATREGFTPSEKTVGKTFDHIFEDNQKKINYYLIL